MTIVTTIITTPNIDSCRTIRSTFDRWKHSFYVSSKENLTAAIIVIRDKILGKFAVKIQSFFRVSSLLLYSANTLSSNYFLGLHSSMYN